MAKRTEPFSSMHERRLSFRQFVQSGNRKTVADALAFAREIDFRLPGHDIAHLIFIGNWKVGTFAITENDREERKTNREAVHARIGNKIVQNYSDCEIEVIEAWKPPT